MSPLIEHHFIQSWKEIPPQSGAVADYLVAGNGIFIRAERPEFSATILWQPLHKSIPNLDPLQPEFKLQLPRVPHQCVQEMIRQAREPQPFKETQFYLLWDAGAWQLVRPPQFGTPSSVCLVDPYSEVHQKGLIEMHSHPPGANEFSSIDDRNADGFRVYGLLTHLLDSTPQLKLRVGIEGYFLEISPDWVFEGEGETA